MLEERWLTKYSRPAKIRFFGVWDTVGSMGIPRSSAEAKVHNYRFLDTHLRLDNEYADALALDEHREDFEATFWTRTVKTGEAGAPDHPVEHVEQRWYVGYHANVGGGCASEVPPDCHEVRDFSGRRNPLKVLCVDPFSPSSAGRSRGFTIRQQRDDPAPFQIATMLAYRRRQAQSSMPMTLSGSDGGRLRRRTTRSSVSLRQHQRLPAAVRQATRRQTVPHDEHKPTLPDARTAIMALLPW